MQSISMITEKVIAQKTGHMMKAGMIVVMIVLKWLPPSDHPPKLKMETYFSKTRLKKTSDNCP